MNVTWTLGFPSGHEQGDYLTLDLGGTNLRVCWIHLQGRSRETEVDQESFRLPDDIKTGQAEQLWDYVADSLRTFIDQRGLKGDADDPLLLGFTFSYPAHQEFVDHGVLQTWTKGFDIDGVEGKDVSQQLREAMERRVSFRPR